MSHHERNAWIRLASLSIVFVPYFSHVLRLLHTDAPIGRAICVAFLAAALAHGLLSGAMQAIARLVFGAEQVDERDAAIDARSLRVAYFSMINLVLAALGTVALLGTVTRPAANGALLLPGFVLVSQYVFFCLVVAEASRYLTQVFCYRREAFA